jgi:hypothetical protein
VQIFTNRTHMHPPFPSRSPRIQTFALVLCATASLASADTLNLRDGQVIQGTFLGGTARQVRLEVNGETRTYDLSLVQSVAFSDPSGNASDDVPASARPPVRPSAPRPTAGITIPADTMITVRMVDSVNSDTSRTGQTFMASLDEPIVVDGRTVVPRGADVMTKLVADQNAGKLQGRTVLTMALVSIRNNGQWVDLSSADVRTESQSQGAKSAKVVGGTTALGAVLGGILGGGKGAAIGAGSGAAVGTGAAVMTSGEKVVIPAETRITFRLQSPAQL